MINSRRKDLLKEINSGPFGVDMDYQISMDVGSNPTGSNSVKNLLKKHPWPSG